MAEWVGLVADAIGLWCLAVWFWSDPDAPIEDEG
jgi:hypothetical protein